MTENCFASWRVLANSLRVVSAKGGNPPLNSTNVVGDLILGINSQFYNYKESFDKDQFLINGLSYNSYTMYSDSLAVYCVYSVTIE